MGKDDVSDTDFGKSDPRPAPRRENSVNPKREARKSMVWIGAGAVAANVAGPIAGDVWSWMKMLAVLVYEHLHISVFWK